MSVRYSLTTAIIELVCHGDLDIRRAEALRHTVFAYAAEDPAAIILDLDGVTIVDDRAVTVLPTQHRQPGPRLVLNASRESSTGRLLRDKLGRHLPIHASRRESEAAALGPPPMPFRLHTRLPAQPSSPARARELVAAACRQWECPDLEDPAKVIVSELVSNAVLHARTDLDVTLVRRDPTLHLRVRDQGKAFPARPPQPGEAVAGGRGLQLVAALATGWGVVTRAYGTMVWASLRIRPPGS